MDGSMPAGAAHLTFYLVDWLPPDFGAVGQYAALFCREMAEAGQNVRLIGLSSRASRDELFEKGNLRITRLATRPLNKNSSVGRLIWALIANCRLVWEVLRDRNARRADVVFTGSPPFMLFFVFICKWVHSVRLVYRITDFYPEVLFAAWGRRPAAFRFFEVLAWSLRRRIDEFQVLGEDQRAILIGGGICPNRIVLKRDLSPVTITGSETPARRPMELLGRKILLYSGNYGVAHDFETVAKGLAIHHEKGIGRFGLWLNASGSSIKPLTSILRAEGIPFSLSEPVSLDRLPELLATADAHLIALRPSFSGYVLPSKIYACLQSRRPILYVGPRSSDVHLLCVQKPNLRYEHVEAGDAEAFASALNRLAANS
jgi:hypothetical protein